MNPSNVLCKMRCLVLRQGQDYFEEWYRQRGLHNLAQRAAKMGIRVVPPEAVA